MGCMFCILILNLVFLCRWVYQILIRQYQCDVSCSVSSEFDASASVFCIDEPDSLISVRVLKIYNFISECVKSHFSQVSKKFELISNLVKWEVWWCVGVWGSMWGLGLVCVCACVLGMCGGMTTMDAMSWDLRFNFSRSSSLILPARAPRRGLFKNDDLLLPLNDVTAFKPEYFINGTIRDGYQKFCDDTYQKPLVIKSLSYN